MLAVSPHRKWRCTNALAYKYDTPIVHGRETSLIQAGQVFHGKFFPPSLTTRYNKQEEEKNTYNGQKHFFKCLAKNFKGYSL